MTLTSPADLFDLPVLMLAHLAVASAALLLGPLALRARKGSLLHRSAGYGWVALMLATAATSLFMRNHGGLNLAGFTPIHLLALLTFAGIGGALWAVWRRNVQAHRRAMWSVYLGGCVVAGVFTLLPGRLLGQLLWHHALGLV